MKQEQILSHSNRLLRKINDVEERLRDLLQEMTWIRGTAGIIAEEISRQMED